MTSGCITGAAAEELEVGVAVPAPEVERHDVVDLVVCIDEAAASVAAPVRRGGDRLLAVSIDHPHPLRAPTQKIAVGKRTVDRFYCSEWTILP